MGRSFLSYKHMFVLWWYHQFCTEHTRGECIIWYNMTSDGRNRPFDSNLPSQVRPPPWIPRRSRECGGRTSSRGPPRRGGEEARAGGETADLKDEEIHRSLSRNRRTLTAWRTPSTAWRVCFPQIRTTVRPSPSPHSIRIIRWIKRILPCNKCFLSRSDVHIKHCLKQGIKENTKHPMALSRLVLLAFIHYMLKDKKHLTSAKRVKIHQCDEKLSNGVPERPQIL